MIATRQNKTEGHMINILLLVRGSSSVMHVCFYRSYIIIFILKYFLLQLIHTSVERWSMAIVPQKKFEKQKKLKIFHYVSDSTKIL